MSTAPILQRALAEYRAGRLAEAERLCRELLALEPENAAALRLLGAVACRAGMSDGAIALLERAHRLERPDAASLNDLGKAYLATGRARDAKRTLRRALALDAGAAEAHTDLGVALVQLGEAADAERSFRRACALDANHARAWFNLGNLLRERGRPSEAEQSYARALALEPGNADALNNRAITLAEAGRREEAVECFRAALALAPGHLAAHHNLGNVLRALGRLTEAETLYRHVLALDPDTTETRVNLASVLKDLGRLDEAIGEFRRVLAVRPDVAEVHYALGNTLYQLDQPEAAQESYRRALALNGDFGAARWESAINTLRPVYDSEDESDRCRTAFAGSLTGLGEWLGAHRVDPTEPAVGVAPFYLAYQEADNRDLLARYGALVATLMRDWADRQRLPRLRPLRGAKVRLGVVSAHVRDHSVWLALVRGWLARVDQARFDLRVFHLGSGEDDETRYARSRASRFEQGGRGLREWAQTILEDRPDVLLYPEIGMDAVTAKLASLRLAPLQVATWGHPETTGLPTIDCYLSAEALEAPEGQAHYTERLVRLPGVGCYCEPLASEVGRSEAVSGAPGGTDGPMLVCAGTPFKYAPQYDRVLVDIARGLGRCRFVFFVHPLRAYSEKLRRRLARAFEAAGLDFDRSVAFLPWQPRPAFYALLRGADVYLDTIGFSGFNTALQALECGLPVVTRDGGFLRGRLASGILRRIGMHELVAASADEYVERALALARDAEYRRSVRARIERSRGVLYGDLAPIRALEAFLLQATA